MRGVLLRSILLLLVGFFGALSFGLWGAVIGLMAGLVGLIFVPRLLRATAAFAPH